MYDSSCANIQVPNFTVTHLPVGQPDVFPAGVNQGVGVFGQQAVVRRLASESNGVRLGLGAVTPAIKNDKY